MSGWSGNGTRPPGGTAGPHSGRFVGGAGSPVASPMGPAANGPFGPVKGAQGPTAVPNHGGSLASPLAPGTRPGAGAAGFIQSVAVRRVGRAQRARLLAELSERDIRVLERIAEHGYLSTSQVQRFVFTDHTSAATAERTARRVLGRLERDRLLVSLPRRQGGPLGGSTPITWGLAPGGARVLREHDRAFRSQTPSIRQLLHCLAIADTHLAILDHAEHAGLTADLQVEPAAWRSYLGLGGERRTLKADLFAQFDGHDADGPYRDDWLIEVDRGTESLPTLLGKCQQYTAYHQAGAWQDHGPSMPLVLWVLPDETRANRLRVAIQRRSGLSPELFRYATPDTIAETLASPDQSGGTS